MMCSIIPWEIWRVATGFSADHSTQWRSTSPLDDGTVNSMAVMMG